MIYLLLLRGAVKGVGVENTDAFQKDEKSRKNHTSDNAQADTGIPDFICAFHTHLDLPDDFFKLQAGGILRTRAS